MEYQTPTGLKQLIQSLCPDGPGVIEGRVTRASPLQITLANDAKMMLGENSLIVPKHLTNYTVNVASEGSELKTITVNGALQQGEKVYLLAYNNGKKYFILGRG